MRIPNRIRSELKFLKRYYRNQRQAAGYPIKFFNFWNVDLTDNWFTNYFRSRGFFEKYPDLDISIFSVFGPKYLIGLNRSKVKVLFIGENVFRKIDLFMKYRDLPLDKVDLVLGFRNLALSNYLRFPLWLTYMFKPESTEADIRRKCENLSRQYITSRNRFAAHVSRQDDELNIRSEIVSTLSKVDKVDCAGLFLKNTNELKNEYDDDKIEYLKNYKFNICPENSDNQYYVTEKLIHSIMAGCIPIYWGANENPEPEIFNQDAIIHWKNDKATIVKIKKLHSSDHKFEEFAQQPRLKPGAADKIIEIFQIFENKFIHIFENKLRI